MPADEVAVTPATLLRHAARIDVAASEVAQAKQAGDTVRVDNVAYGQLCVIVPTLINSLQDIVLDAIGVADASLHDTAQRLRSVADSYLETDRVNEEDIRRIETGR
jgi:Excreted virulence factor EspC, type VII ESX diderm